MGAKTSLPKSPGGFKFKWIAFCVEPCTHSLIH
jgi:hypothetical protein